MLGGLFCRLSKHFNVFKNAPNSACLIRTTLVNHSAIMAETYCIVTQEGWAQEYKPEEGEWYEEEWLVHGGYLADGEEDTDLLALQAQLRGLNIRPSGVRGEEAPKRGPKVRHAPISHDTGAREDGQIQVSAQSEPNSDLETEWDSDDSLHVKPLSELSSNSAEDDIETWRADIDSYRRAAIEHGADSGTDVSRAGKAKPARKLSPAQRASAEPEPFKVVAARKGRASRKRGSQSRSTNAQAGKDAALCHSETTLHRVALAWKLATLITRVDSQHTRRRAMSSEQRLSNTVSVLGAWKAPGVRAGITGSTCKTVA